MWHMDEFYYIYTLNNVLIHINFNVLHIAYSYFHFVFKAMRHLKCVAPLQTQRTQILPLRQCLPDLHLSGGCIHPTSLK